MAENLSQVMWGEGVAFIDGKELFEIQNLSINFGLDVLSAKKGDGGGDIIIPVNQPITGRAEGLSLNAAVLAELTGGSSATGTRTRIRSENLSVSTDTVTCSQTPITNTLRVIEQAANSQPLKQVSSSPSADEYTVSGTTITFNASAFEDDVVIEVSYLYDVAGSGETFSLDVTDLPSTFELYGTLRTKELFDGDKGDVTIYAAKCQRTGAVTIGGAKDSLSLIGFDFNIEIALSSDFNITFPA